MKVIKWLFFPFIFPFVKADEKYGVKDVCGWICCYIIIFALVCAIFFPKVLDSIQEFFGYSGW